MRAGRLRDRIIIEQATPTRDEFGDEIVEWESVCVRWAGVEPVSGSEQWTQFQETGTQRITCVLRHDSIVATITPKMRVNHGGAYYDIESVVNTGNRDREVQLSCSWRQIPEVYP